MDPRIENHDQRRSRATVGSIFFRSVDRGQAANKISVECKKFLIPNYEEQSSSSTSSGESGTTSSTTTTTVKTSPYEFVVHVKHDAVDLTKVKRSGEGDGKITLLTVPASADDPRDNVKTLLLTFTSAKSFDTTLTTHRGTAQTITSRPVGSIVSISGFQMFVTAGNQDFSVGATMQVNIPDEVYVIPGKVIIEDTSTTSTSTEGETSSSSTSTSSQQYSGFDISVLREAMQSSQIARAPARGLDVNDSGVDDKLGDVFTKAYLSGGDGLPENASSISTGPVHYFCHINYGEAEDNGEQVAINVIYEWSGVSKGVGRWIVYNVNHSPVT